MKIAWSPGCPDVLIPKSDYAERVWFTSDQHFGHRNIIAYSGRPFRDLEHMHEELVNRHNAIVKPEEPVWHLGDFALDERMVGRFLPRLNGRHRLVVGNHDACHPCHRRWMAAARRYGKHFGFVQTAPVGIWSDEDYCRGWTVYLGHMPPPEAEDPRYPEWRPAAEFFASGTRNLLLHGHVHERWKRRGNCLNVGVDQWDYGPVSLARLLDLAGAA